MAGDYIKIRVGIKLDETIHQTQQDVARFVKDCFRQHAEWSTVSGYVLDGRNNLIVNLDVSENIHNEDMKEKGDVLYDAIKETLFPNQSIVSFDIYLIPEELTPVPIVNQHTLFQQVAQPTMVFSQSDIQAFYEQEVADKAKSSSSSFCRKAARLTEVEQEELAKRASLEEEKKDDEPSYSSRKLT